MRFRAEGPSAPFWSGAAKRDRAAVNVAAMRNIHDVRDSTLHAIVLAMEFSFAGTELGCDDRDYANRCRAY